MSVFLPNADLVADGSAGERNQAIASRERTRLGHAAALNIDSQPTELRRTSIICTVGPKTNDVKMIAAMRDAGMEIMRLNFSYETHEFHAKAVANLHESLRLKPGPPVAIAVDTHGATIRTGKMADKEVNIEVGDKLTIHTDPSWAAKGTKTDIFCDHPSLTENIYVGSEVFIDDGKLRFEVTAVQGEAVQVVCRSGGPLGDRRGMNFPGVILELPSITDKDKADILWGVENGVDFIFASFVRQAADVAAVRRVLGEKGKNIKVIAKIENGTGVQNIRQIAAESDGIMVGRGDLGIELHPEKVFVAQKMICAVCNEIGIPVICAAQMLESMTINPRPTRAEVSDVANAVLDGFDSVMLSGETARGAYPIETVKMMAKVALEAEAAFIYRANFEEVKTVQGGLNPNEIIALAAVEEAYSSKAGCIVVLTASGSTARLVSKYRPRCPILVVTKDPQVARQVQLSRGVYPLIYTEKQAEIFQDELDRRIYWALGEAVKAGYLRKGDAVVATQGWRDTAGATNTVRVLVVP
eukprot:comp19254_c0_seq1/m.22042 comp19254_c0_seq1/g.22042  ORF comp19254_c0_seq1/g.22042 comp19254_c0_seq1/m.22042 type:complete len:527 (-) comp19254_c0_seq1:421-2001(-)